MSTATLQSNDFETTTQLLEKAKSQFGEIIELYKNGIDCIEKQKQINSQFDAQQIIRNNNPLNHCIIISPDEEQDHSVNNQKFGAVNKCIQCNKTFYFITDYEKHLISEHDYRPYQCTQCNSSFKRKFNLNAHIRRVHNKEQRYQCICGKTFFAKNDLKKHHNIHTNTGQHECNYCDRRFVTKSMLISHTRSHTNERPFECIHCHKRFTLKSNLLKHLNRKNSCTQNKNVISNSDEFPENACVNNRLLKKDYKANSIINKMNRIHWYTCTQCSQSFQLVDDFKTHQIKEHACYAPFKCIECNGAFTKRGNLDRHQKVIHGWGKS
eukprot:419010_1